MPWMCTFVFEYLLFLSCESFSRSLKINNKTLIPVLYATSSEVLVMCIFLNLKLIQKYSTLVQKMANMLLKINYRNLPVN